jgi:hypothetical protein
MKTFRTTSGYKLQIDNTIKVGDLVTGYHKGFHRVISVGQPYAGASTYLVYYEAVLDSKCNPVRSKTKRSCDLSYCRKIDKEYLVKVAESHQTQLTNLKNAIGE